jgi:hypothetical protein
MVSGPLIFAESSGASNKNLHLVVALTTHEITAIDSVWLNDVEIDDTQIDGSGNVTGTRFAGLVRIKKHLGAAAQTADSDLVAETNFTSEHRGRGIAYVYPRLQWNQDVFPTGIPNVRAVVRGREVWDPRLDPGNPSVRSFSNNAALCQLDYLMSDFGFVAPLTEIHESSWVAAANVCDEQVTVTADPRAFTVTTSQDTLNFTGARKWGLGDIVQVTTTGTLPSPLVAATDYYVAPYLVNSLRVATTLANALAGIVIDITTTGSGTHTVTRDSQLRYTCDGSFKVDQKPASIMDDLLTSSAGTLVYQQGTFRGYAGSATTPTSTLDESDLRGKITVIPRPSISEAFNAVRGTFTDANDDKAPYSLTDFPPITNATFEAEDNNERVFNEIELLFTTDKTRAQRIANLLLLRARQGITVKFPAKLTQLELAPWDVVTLSIAQAGFVDKEFRLLEWALAGDGGVDLTFQEEAAAVYDFGPGDEINIDPAPDTNLPDPFIVEPPTGLALASGTASLFLKADGTVVSRIKATWTAPADIFVTVGGKIEVQFKKTADSDWTQLAPVPGDTTEVFVWDVEDGVSYDLRIRALNSLNVASDISDPWSATVTGHTVVGKTALPRDVTGFSAAQNGNVVNFSWVQVIDIDLAGYEIRYNPQGTTVWADATPLTEVTRGTAITNAHLPPGVWTTLIKAKDTSGNESANAVSADVTVVAEDFDIILQTEQAPRWLGTLTDMVKHYTGVLVPDSQNLASDDDFDTFDIFVVNPVAIAIYEAPEFDIDFDDTVRVWGDIASVLGPGETVGVAAPAFEVDYRKAADGFDGFEPWTIGNLEARFIKHRLVLDTSKGVAKVTGFKPTVDLLERDEGATSVAVAASGQAISFARTFHVAPRVTVTADAAAARIATKDSVTTSGFTAHVFNTGGSDVGGTVDWSARGA